MDDDTLNALKKETLVQLHNQGIAAHVAHKVNIPFKSLEMICAEYSLYY